MTTATTSLMFAQAGSSLLVAASSNVFAGLAVVVLFGGALYAICRSSRR